MGIDGFRRGSTDSAGPSTVSHGFCWELDLSPCTAVVVGQIPRIPLGLGIRPHLKLNRKALSFLLFLGGKLQIMCDLLSLRYFQNHLLHSIMLLVKTIKTMKFVTIRTKSFYSLCCWMTRFSWLLLPVFLVTTNTASSDIATRSFLFFELVISWFALRMSCWLLSRTRYQLLEWHTKK